MAKLITLDNLQEFLTKGNSHWLVRGDFDGTTGVGYSDLANNLTGTGSVEQYYVLRNFTASNVLNDDGDPVWNLDTSVGSQDATWSKIKGGTYIKNQLCQSQSSASYTKNGISISVSGYSYTITAGTSGGTSDYAVLQNITPTIGHKYLIVGAFAQRRDSSDAYVANLISSAGNMSTWMKGSVVDTAGWNAGDKIQMQVFIAANKTYVTGTYYYKVVDLTLWYQAFPSLIPTIPEQFFADFPAFNGGSVAYDAGTAFQVETDLTMFADGLNQWDEEISANYIYNQQGQKVSTSSCDCSKNLIPVFPSTTYVCTRVAGSTYATSNIYLRWFDSAGNAINSEDQGELHSFGTQFASPANAAYVGLNTAPSKHFGANPKIGFYWYASGTDPRLSAYEHYESWLNDFSWIDELVDGDGNKLFPYGLNGNANVKDEIDFDAKKAARKWGKVDLATLEPVYNSTAKAWFFGSLIKSKPVSSASALANVIHAKYKAVTRNDGYGIDTNPNIMYVADTGYVYINDGSSSDKPTGYLYFELATYVEGDLPDSVSNAIKSDDMGVQLLGKVTNDAFAPVNMSAVDTAPFDIDIEYLLDSPAQIRNLETNYYGKSEGETLAGKVTALEGKVPAVPSADGTYVLKATVADDEVTYSWVAESE